MNHATLSNAVRRAALMLAALLAAPAALALSNEPIHPSEAFPYEARVAGDEIVVSWQVVEGYYLYRDKISFALEGDGVALDAPFMPAGTPHSDEFFGEQPIFEDDFEVRIPYTGSGPATLVLRSQGCSSALGICYPPQTWKTDLTLTAAASSSAASSLASPFGVTTQNDFLPHQEAFAPVIAALAGNRIDLGWQIAPDYYLYRHTIEARLSGDRARVAQVELPAGKAKYDEYFGDTEVYYDQVLASFVLERTDVSAGRETLQLTYQGCAEDGICYPPIEKSFEITLPAGEAGAPVAASAAGTSGGAGPGAGEVVSDQARLASLITSSNLLAMLGTFFGFGLLLALTPCVLPMVPILSGIIAGDGDNVTPARGFFLALLYVLGMALTYTVAGAIAAAAGQQAQTFFQQPWILATFAGLFVVLAMSMFGLFELQMPSAIQTRIANLSGGQKSGTAVGAFVMGALSSLVVTACVAPPLVAALAVIGQSGDVVRGSLALFALSMGMGTPLLLVGASAGRLLPKAGVWMERVKQAFGFVMLGLAVWMLSRILPGEITLLLWAVLIFMGGVFLGALTPLPEQPTGPRQMGKGFGLLAVLYGAVLFVGALTGGEDPLHPLEGSVLAGGGGGAAAQHTELEFVRVKTVAELDQAIAAASRQGQAVMLDFYADWCVSCKEMEKYTFTDAEVQRVLASTVLLQADVTANDSEDQALMQRFGIFGPPSIIFFGPDGTERPGYQLAGYMKADKFVTHARAATAPAGMTANR